jgi:hypothetical protein
MGPQKLADSLLITEQEAENLIDDYFAAFPAIKNFLFNLGHYGITNGHIKTYAPYRRMRWFPEWKGYDTPFKARGKIERASKNTPKLVWVKHINSVFKNWMNCWKAKGSPPKPISSQAYRVGRFRDYLSYSNVA